jgi:signal transduction histidine kinase
LAAVYLALCFYALISTRNWVNRPFPGFLTSRSNTIPMFMLARWEGFQKGLKNRDRILAVNGKPVRNSKELDAVILATEPGTALSFTVARRHEGDRVNLELTVSRFSLGDYLILVPGIMLLGAVLYATGLIVFYLKPNMKTSWAFLLLCAAVGFCDASGGEYATNHRLFFSPLTYQLVGPGVLLVSLFFPLEKRWRRPLSYLILIASAALMIALVLTTSNPKVFSFLFQVSVGFSWATRGIGIMVMVHSFVISKQPLVRQQAKVVILGFVLAFLILAGLIVNALFFKPISLLWTLIPWAIIPLALFYAIIKHNLFDVDVFIRKTASYLLASAVAVIVFFLVTAALSLLVQQLTGSSSQLAAVASTLLAVVVFRPLQVRVDRGLDRRFDRERHEYTATIRKAASILNSIIDLDELLHQLLATVRDAIKIERGLVALRAAGADELAAVVAAGFTEAPGPAPADHPLLARLEQIGKAVQLNDLTALDESRPERAPMLALMNAWGIVLAVPIIYERRLIGVLGLSAKKSGAWYSSDDIELLSTLMLQTAVSIENAGKVLALKKMVELETSYRELKHLDEMKDNFLSMVSHDLRTPMTSIKGYASILSEKIDRLDRDRQKRYLDIIITESDRLTRLISDLLDLQRFEAGKMKLDLQDTDLNPLIEQSVASFQGAAIAKNIGLEKTLPPDPVIVSADPDRLLQVIANLLSNAIKFTPERGQVHVSVTAGSHDDRPFVSVAVADTGPGIPPDEQTKLFSKFQQVESLVRGKNQGSGLGLALVREIVEHHQGKVLVQSQPGHGSVFSFTLPLQPTNQPPQGES